MSFPLFNVGYRFFIYIALIRLGYVLPNKNFLRILTMKERWILSKAFSVSVEVNMWFLSLSPFLECITLTLIYISSHPWHKSNLIVVSYLFDVFMNVVSKYFVRIVSKFFKDIDLWFLFLYVSLVSLSCCLCKKSVVVFLSSSWTSLKNISIPLWKCENSPVNPSGPRLLIIGWFFLFVCF